MRARRLSEENALSVLLVLLILRLLVLPPLVPSVGAATLAFPGAIGLIMALGILVIARRPVLAYAWIALVVASVSATIVVRVTGAYPALESLVDSFEILTLSAITAVVLARVHSSGHVTGHRIRGSIAAYLLIALVFAAIFQMLEKGSPGSFAIAAAPDLDRKPGDELFYYSMITLTTTGYGDITPLSSWARSLAMLEALIGQLYPAILIARLVTLEIESRRSRGQS